jgi:hypothetical protein
MLLTWATAEFAASSKAAIPLHIAIFAIFIPAPRFPSSIWGTPTVSEPLMADKEA